MNPLGKVPCHFGYFAKIGCTTREAASCASRESRVECIRARNLFIMFKGPIRFRCLSRGATGCRPSALAIGVPRLILGAKVPYRDDGGGPRPRKDGVGSLRPWVG